MLTLGRPAGPLQHLLLRQSDSAADGVIMMVQSIDVKMEVVASIAGERVIGVSSVVTIDPRRRKFHRPVTVSVPLTAVPTSRQVAAAASDLRLFCNLAGTPPISNSAALICLSYYVYKISYIIDALN